MIRFAFYVGLVIAGAGLTPRGTLAAAPDQCPTTAQPIATDRPDVTNSSIVVSVGSLQIENGIDFSEQHGDRALDGSNSRVRLGIAPCLEVLLDVPSYLWTQHNTDASGFSNLSPAIKWQVGPMGDNFDLSAVLGVGLPTGSAAINGPGAQPYLQFPWSKELNMGLELSGMLTFFGRPADPDSALTTETTLAVDKKLTDQVEIFTELVGDYPSGGPSRQLINSGALWQFAKTQQLDLHVAFGLNRNSPDLIVGVGYSWRIDRLFN
jgi:hypothetical protein